MLICITNVIVVFPSSPSQISVVFRMFSVCFTSLHLFAYGFKRVIQVRDVASIHLRGRPKSETWKIGLYFTFKVTKCLCSIKSKCKGWIPWLLCSGHLGTTVCIYVATPSATSSSWNPSHPSKKLLNGSTKYKVYDTNQLQLKKCEVNSTNIWMTPSTAHFYDPSSGKLPLLTVICYLEAPKNKRSSKTWLTHPSSSPPPIGAEIFRKNRKYISTLHGSSE